MFLLSSTQPTPNFRRGDRLIDVSNGWAKLKLEEAAATGERTLDIKAGTPMNVVEEAEAGSNTEREELRALTKKALAGEKKAQVTVAIRPFPSLRTSAQVK